MSKKAALLTTEDVPKYIQEIVKQLSPVLVDYEDELGNWWGYTFKLNAKWKIGYESQLESDTEKLIKWANRWHAYAKIIKYNWWTECVPCTSIVQGDRWHRRKAWRMKFRNHAIIVISDPVASRFEKDNFYRNN